MYFKQIASSSFQLLSRISVPINVHINDIKKYHTQQGCIFRMKDIKSCIEQKVTDKQEI